MKYLLDTNILIEQLRGRKPLETSLVEKGISISLLTLAELYYGAYKSNRPADNLREIQETVEDLTISIVPLDEVIVKRYAKLKADFEKKGKRLDEFDLLIAATALSLDLTLVSKNRKHFQRIPQLKLFPVL